MPRLPARTGKQVARVLAKNGFALDHVTGSHHIFVSADGSRRVTVPIHRKDLPKGTLREILKQSGLTVGDIT
ncbi:MAG: type II toxin-antitoxin system HicA family toxin [Patescibacteria group bacterium]|nr:type II toxin-antitoxin system HicA family toxin [bacterium]MDZ4227139.1 type II toxin-antitoxin system HicA family toxin [Patescibacteria group bacterium]